MTSCYVSSNPTESTLLQFIPASRAFCFLFWVVDSSGIVPKVFANLKYCGANHELKKLKVAKFAPVVTFFTF